MNISELKAEVRRLEGEVAAKEKERIRLSKEWEFIEATLPGQIAAAKQEAIKEAQDAEYLRYDEIQAVAAKYAEYGEPREFDRLVLAAYAGGDSVCDFKEAMLEIISNRVNAQPTSKRAEWGGDDRRSMSAKSEKIDKLRAKLSGETDPKNKRALIQEISALRNQKTNTK